MVFVQPLCASGEIYHDFPNYRIRELILNLSVQHANFVILQVHKKFNH